MGANWTSSNWLELLQSIGIIGAFLLTGYVAWKDEHARRIGNSIAITDQYRQIWRELYRHPELARVLVKDVDLEKHPASKQEEIFVTTLILHLGTVYRAMERHEFVKLEGLRKDVEEFFALPIPDSVWKKIKPFQNADFTQFVENCLSPR
jgi:hypothetical protein